MTTDKPFRKSLACAGVLFVVIITIMVASKTQVTGYRLGYVLSSCTLPALVTGAWGATSRKPWSWGRFAGTVIGLYFLFAFIIAQGRARG